ncbi:MAG: ABC transporter permease [Oscillospiraceae bacterium]
MTNSIKQHTQPIRIEKRKELNNKQALALRLCAFLVAIVVGGLFIAAMGENPFEAYWLIIKGAFVGGKRNPFSAIQATIIKWIPLVMVSIGLSFAFKMKFWNIGGEGQIMMGAVFAGYFAVCHPEIPRFLLLPLMFIAGMVGGGIWALIPALFKVKFGTNETLFTLMLNYIALYIINYLESGPWQGTKGFASIAAYSSNVLLPKVFGIHIGWIIAIVVIILSFVYLKYTKSGYEISVVGESQATARYAGMNVKKIVIRTMFISGAICGLVGMIQSTGYDNTLTVGVTGGVGWSGIIVAWLSQLSPLVIAFVSALFSILEKGSSLMQSQLGLSSYAADVLQSIILFFVLGSEFFIRYRFVFNKKGASK